MAKKDSSSGSVMADTEKCRENVGGHVGEKWVQSMDHVNSYDLTCACGKKTGWGQRCSSCGEVRDSGSIWFVTGMCKACHPDFPWH